MHLQRQGQEKVSSSLGRLLYAAVYATKREGTPARTPVTYRDRSLCLLLEQSGTVGQTSSRKCCWGTLTLPVYQYNRELGPLTGTREKHTVVRLTGV